jgi:hypothetical protein
MPTWVWIAAAAVAVVAVVAVLVAASRRRRTGKLKERFGPEYDRVAADAPTRREAEAELREREERREELDIRPLDPRDAEYYRVAWEKLQVRFVDDPPGAVTDADRLIQSAMRDRGYPVDDFETRAAALSVDHPHVVEHYREGHRTAVAHERGEVGTEDLRQAFQHYRALFEELVEPREREESRR